MEIKLFRYSLWLCVFIDILHCRLCCCFPIVSLASAITSNWNCFPSTEDFPLKTIARKKNSQNGTSSKKIFIILICYHFSPKTKNHKRPKRWLLLSARWWRKSFAANVFTLFIQCKLVCILAWFFWIPKEFIFVIRLVLFSKCSPEP